jgi:hypothetical protein
MADQPRTGSITLVARGLFFFSGLATLLCGIIFVSNQVSLATNCQGPNCIGPSLTWGGWLGGANGAWANTFTLSPNNFVRNFLAVFVGILTMAVHFPGFEINFLCRTWMHVSLWSVFVVCFANLPYAGNIGILAACVTTLLAVIAFILYFTHRHEPTTLNISFGHSGFCACLAGNTCVIEFTRLLSLLVGLFTLAIGLIHVFDRSFQWCPSGTFTDCLGPSIIWQTGSTFIADVNNDSRWRSVFTLQPEIVGPLWGPVVFGYITTIQHFDGHQIPLIFMSWPRAVFWHLFIAFFCGFGYVGNLGILDGFASVLVALLGTLITFAGGGKTAPHFTLKMRGMSSNRV